MQFYKCSGYENVLLLCWNVDEEKGVLLNGSGITKPTLNFTFGTISRKTYFVSFVDNTTIVEQIRTQLGNALPRFSETYLRWQLKSQTHIKEMIGNHYLINVLGFTFPTDQNSKVDLLDRDGVRHQLKTADEKTLQFHLHTNSGRKEDGTQKHSAYKLDNGSFPFDFVNVFLIKDSSLHRWIFPVDGLLGGATKLEYKDASGTTFLKDFKSIFSFPNNDGCQAGLVYFPDSLPPARKGDRRSWSFQNYEQYYKGSVPLSSFMTEELLNAIPSDTRRVVDSLMAPAAASSSSAAGVGADGDEGGEEEE